VDVAELRYAKTVEFLCQARKADFVLGYVQPMPVNFACIKCRACCTAEGRLEKCAS
jgi:hypothetical protein